MQLQLILVPENNAYGRSAGADLFVGTGLENVLDDVVTRRQTMSATCDDESIVPMICIIPFSRE